MYALYLDGSGTHGGSPVFILGGIAVHEQDAYHLQQRFAAPLANLPGGPDPRDYELHAAEIKSPSRPKRPSIWENVPAKDRFSILRRSYRALGSYKCMDSQFPCAYFGAVVERSYVDYQERAWEEVLHRFDEMLTRQGNQSGDHQRGVVIHDRDAIESQAQNWTDKWRLIAGRIGLLTHMIDVPFFSDSRASRLLQAADFVSWALWRYYGLAKADDRWIEPLWAQFDSADDVMHGLVHVTRNFGPRVNRCGCPACMSRATAAGIPSTA